MRKNKLIELLQSIKGNPEIVIWDGRIGDYININELVETDLVKRTLDYYIENNLNQERIERNDYSIQYTDDEISELKKMYKKLIEWEVNLYVFQRDIDEKRYLKKRVLCVLPKKRNEWSFDRIGTVMSDYSESLG